MKELFLPGLPVEKIRAAYAAAPGKELETGRLDSPESSAALAANSFGFFLDRPDDLPPLPGTENSGWPAIEVRLEAEVRFPWSGGYHPWLDALVKTGSALIGVESKRYEPFRTKPASDFSKTYWREVWGRDMRRFERVRDGLEDSEYGFAHLDAAQLVKHAFGLRTAVHRKSAFEGKQPVLFYVYAEPRAWPDSRTIDDSVHERHRAETRRFADLVAGDEVIFHACSYDDLLSSWDSSSSREIRDHAGAVRAKFTP